MELKTNMRMESNILKKRFQSAFSPFNASSLFTMDGAILKSTACRRSMYGFNAGIRPFSLAKTSIPSVPVILSPRRY
jgi:hypothetical protein